MTNFEFYNKHFEIIKEQFLRGIISYSQLNQYLVYSRYDYHLKAGNKKPDAIIQTSCEMNISKQYMYKIIKQMEAE